MEKKFKTENLKLSREQELVMFLTTKEIKTIIKALEWSVEGNYRDQEVDVGKTNIKDIFKVLDKLK